MPFSPHQATLSLGQLMNKKIDNFSFPGAVLLTMFAFCCLLLPFDFGFSDPGFQLFYSVEDIELIFLFYCMISCLGLDMLVGMLGSKKPTFTLKMVLLVSVVLSLVFLAGVMALGLVGVGTIALCLIQLGLLGLTIADVRAHYLSDFNPRTRQNRPR